MAVWITLFVLAGCLAVGLALAIYRGICLWRLMKRSGGAVSSELDRIAQNAAQFEEHLARAGESAKRLEEMVRRLAEARARLEVQLAALREAKATLGRALWFVPGR